MRLLSGTKDQTIQSLAISLSRLQFVRRMQIRVEDERKTIKTDNRIIWIVRTLTSVVWDGIVVPVPGAVIDLRSTNCGGKACCCCCCGGDEDCCSCCWCSPRTPPEVNVISFLFNRFFFFISFISFCSLQPFVVVFELLMFNIVVLFGDSLQRKYRKEIIKAGIHYLMGSLQLWIAEKQLDSSRHQIPSRRESEKNRIRIVISLDSFIQQ